MTPEVVAYEAWHARYLQLCEHEAAHASAALACGFDVDEVRAVRNPHEFIERRDHQRVAGCATVRADPEHDARTLAIITLAGPLEERKPHWPPDRLNHTPVSCDEADLLDYCKHLGIEHDTTALRKLIQETYELLGSRPYEHGRAVISALLEEHGHVNADQLRLIKRSME